MREIKSDEQHRREYLEAEWPEFEQEFVNWLVMRPPTIYEAGYLLRQRLLDCLSALPVVGRYFS